MTNVVGRLKYAKTQATKLPAVSEAQKMDRKSINVEIKAKTDYEQAQKRIVSVSGRFVGVAVSVGLPMAVFVNDEEITRIEATTETSGASYQEVKTCLLNYLDSHKDADMRIKGILG